MPRHSYDDLLRALPRGELAPVYYLFGAEEVLKDEAVRGILERALAPGERDFNLDQRTAAGLEPETLHALVNTLPMLAARRCVVVSEIEAWKRKPAVREVLLRYLANPAPDTVLILVESAPSEEKRREWKPDEEILGRSWGVEFEPLPPDRVARWITHQAKQKGIAFGEGAADHLALAAGYELGVLQTELEKLAGLAEPGPISRERVGELVGVRHGETIEDWVDAVLADDPARAVALTRRILEQPGMSGVKAVNTLGTALVGLGLARALLDDGKRGRALEGALFDRLRVVRPFGLGDWKRAVATWSRRAPAWPAPRIRAALAAALEADQALKSTRITDEAGVVTGLALALGEPALSTAAR